MMKKILLVILLLITTTNIYAFLSACNAQADTNRLSKPLVGARINPLHPMSRDLVAWWLFNDGAGSTLTDIIGKHQGSLINMDANVWVGNPRGGALDFDGVNDYVDIVNNSLFENMVTNANVNKTLAIWFNADTLAAESASHLHPSLMSKGDTYMNFGVDNSGEIAFMWYDGITQRLLTSGAGISTGLWYHAAVVLNEGTVTLYVNGVNKGSGSFTGLHAGATGGTEWFGTVSGIQGTQRWDGKIDNARIYNRALSAEEVAELHRNPYIVLLRTDPTKWYGVNDPAASFTPTVTWW